MARPRKPNRPKLITWNVSVEVFEILHTIKKSNETQDELMKRILEENSRMKEENQFLNESYQKLERVNKLWTTETRKIKSKLDKVKHFINNYRTELLELKILVEKGPLQLKKEREKSLTSI